ncbi:MAG: hypothetical protein K0R51_2135 [Cytophagaceae bacterium]|nr:hypothetical protein [Cytophagaceae bacterium]
MLAVAVGVLYYLHFSCAGSCATSKTETTTTDSSNHAIANEAVIADSAIAYIPDSLPASGTVAYINLEELTEMSWKVHWLKKMPCSRSNF